jgi:hypothetical protein
MYEKEREKRAKWSDPIKASVMYKKVREARGGVIQGDGIRGLIYPRFCFRSHHIHIVCIGTGSLNAAMK